MTAVNIAKYVITKCIDDGERISNLQLQKILADIQQAYIDKHGHPLFYDEIEEHRFGPMIPDVYYRFCGFGVEPIRQRYPDYDITDVDVNLINDVTEESRKPPKWVQDWMNET